jgi:hypothetical protein
MSDVDAIHDLVQKRMNKKRNRENYSRSGCGRSSLLCIFSGGHVLVEFRLAKPN